MKLKMTLVMVILFSAGFALADSAANLTKTINCRSFKGAEKTVYYHAFFNPKKNSWPVTVLLTIDGLTGEASDRVESNDGDTDISVGEGFKSIESEGYLTSDDGQDLSVKVTSIDGSISLNSGATPKSGLARFKAKLDGTIVKNGTRTLKAQQEVVCTISWKALTQ